MIFETIIESMISKANQTTSKTDSNLTAAIQSLVDGFGGSGSNYGIQLIENGIYNHSTTGSITIGLSTIPDIVVCYLDEDTEYEGTPTKAWVLIRLPDEINGHYGFSFPSASSSMKDNIGYASLAITIAGAKGVNTTTVAALSTCNIGYGRASGSATTGFDKCFTVAQRSTAYAIIPGQYHWYTYNYIGFDSNKFQETVNEIIGDCKAIAAEIDEVIG